MVYYICSGQFDPTMFFNIKGKIMRNRDKRGIQPVGYPYGLLPDAKGRSQSETRICFGINWYELEEDAVRADKETRKQGNYYNGGMFHGMRCGRDRTWDYTDDDGIKWYAVTD